MKVEKIKILIIYSHPNSKSFNHAILENLIKGLKVGEQNFEVVDLYEIGFNPVLNINDFIQFSKSKTAIDVMEQQKKITDADTIIFIHPTWWGGMPAMLKGYLDRVFTIGFAYKMGKTQPEGLLDDKKVIILRTTALPEELYQKSGVEDLIQNLHSFKFKVVCGVRDLEQHVFYAVTVISDEARKKYLEKVYQLGKTLK